MKRIHRTSGRLLPLGVLFIVATLLLWFSPAYAQNGNSPVLTQFGDYVFSTDLTVAAGDRYNGDVTVLAGNTRIEQGGRIDGNLNVLSGNVEVQSGGAVAGNISALSGDVWVAGEVGGDVAAMSGNIELAETAVVAGDVSVVSGNLLRAPGAVVAGDVVRGKGFSLPFRFGNGAGESTRPLAPGLLDGRQTFWGWLGGLILRLVLAVLAVAVVVALVLLFHNLRPDLLRPIYEIMVERTAFSFIVGLLVNLVLGVLTVGLFATLILCLGGILTGALLLVLNLVGWAVVSQYVGNRLAASLQTPVQPLASTGLGALLLTGVVALLWALGGCFRPAAYLIWLLVSSAGVGAALVYWLKLAPPAPAADVDASTPPPAPASPAATDEAAVAPVRSTAQVSPVASEVAAADQLAEQTPPESVAEAPPAPETSAPVAEDDFTMLRGIGPTFDRRLKEAGVRTFAQLAALTPEEAADIIGWPPQRVISDDLLGQARRLALGGAGE
jgi:predicted flap endonuclease-1-like 5' DNA nuclease/cytoskeletal protein CcmA (bactofilin family)